jgi:hypothetical protein
MRCRRQRRSRTPSPAADETPGGMPRLALEPARCALGCPAPWFDNHKRLRELITELEALSLAIAENDPRWNR